MNMRTLIITSFAFTLSLSTLGCGSDINDAEPRVIPGGGIGDGAILGLVNVAVIDADTDAPINGARVLVGEPGETPLEGLTDSSGLITIKDDSLDGPTTITVVAADYSVATWFGANGANVTIPLDPTAAVVPQIPQATLTGTIAGWADLPLPDTNHLTLAVVSYSGSTQLGDPANEIPQGNLANICAKAPVVGGDCAWTLNARTGTIAVFAILLDLDTKGTPDDADDQFQIIGFAYKLDTTVEDNVDQSGLILEQLDAGAMEDVTVTLATPPSGLQASAILALDIGDSGLIMAGIVDAASDIARVPSLSGPFAGASYRGFAFANQDGQEGGPSSAILLRGITDVTGGVDFGPWLDLPADVTFANGEYSFTPSGEALHIGELRDAAGEQFWGIALLDGRTSFTLPGLDSNPLPAGDITFQVTALDGTIDVGDFSIDALLDSFQRTSANVTTFTN